MGLSAVKRGLCQRGMYPLSPGVGRHAALPGCMEIRDVYQYQRAPRTAPITGILQGAYLAIGSDGSLHTTGTGISRRPLGRKGPARKPERYSQAPLVQPKTRPCALSCL